MSSIEVTEGPAGSRVKPPTSWRRVFLGDTLVLRKEVIHPHDNPKGPATFVGLEHIEPGTGRRTGCIRVEMSELTGRKPRFYRGDIVYGYLRPYLNKVWVAEFDGLCSVDQYVFAVRSDVADPDYIAWFMRSPIYLSRAPIGETPGQLPRIRTDEVASVKLNLPPLFEQHRIVVQLAEQMKAVERARAAAVSQLKAAKVLPEASLRALFTGDKPQRWPKKRFGDICEIKLGKMLSPASKTGIRPRSYLRNANVQWARIDLADIAEMDFTEAEGVKFGLRRGDLLICEGGEPGRCAVWQDQIAPCYYQKALHRVRPFDSSVDPYYLMYRLWWGAVQGEFTDSHSQSTIAHLPSIRLAALTLSVPSLAEQRRVVTRMTESLKDTERLKALLEAQLANIDKLPSRLLAQAFSGVI